MQDNIINTAAISGIYARAAAITAGATTQDPIWWEDVHNETIFLLREAMGKITRPDGDGDGFYLPSLDSITEMFS